MMLMVFVDILVVKRFVENYSIYYWEKFLLSASIVYIGIARIETYYPLENKRLEPEVMEVWFR